MKRSVRKSILRAARAAGGSRRYPDCRVTVTVDLPPAVTADAPTWAPYGYCEGPTARRWARADGPGLARAVVLTWSPEDGETPVLASALVTASDLLGIAGLCDKPHRIRWVAAAGTRWRRPTRPQSTERGLTGPGRRPSRCCTRNQARRPQPARPATPSLSSTARTADGGPSSKRTWAPGPGRCMMTQVSPPTESRPWPGTTGPAPGYAPTRGRPCTAPAKSRSLRTPRRWPFSGRPPRPRARGQRLRLPRPRNETRRARRGLPLNRPHDGALTAAARAPRLPPRSPGCGIPARRPAAASLPFPATAQARPED